jgi:2-polyprenyl-3-methyl-5-hydroxy-6-metoxy-1,4-benzoquinol methylase
MSTNSNGGTMTDDQVLQWELQAGIGFHNHEFTTMWHTTFGVLRQYTGEIRSLCDLGTGTGVWPTVAKNSGVKHVTAYDRNKHHADYHAQHGNPKVRYIVDDFTTALPSMKKWRVYDVMSSIEVFEHIPDEELMPLIERLSQHCNWFLFSSTPHRAPTDEAWGHINIKPTEEWQRIFEANGFKFIVDLRTPTPWTMLFKSPSAPSGWPN